MSAHDESPRVSAAVGRENAVRIHARLASSRNPRRPRGRPTSKHVTFHITNHVYVVAKSSALEGCLAKRVCAETVMDETTRPCFQLVREDRRANRVRSRQQYILHPRLRRVDDGAAYHQTPVSHPLLAGRRTHVPLAARDGLHVVLDGWI